jgi:hypothetical protein
MTAVFPFRKILQALVTALFALGPVNAYAWGRTGHEIITAIALHYLTQPAKEQMQELLGSVQPEDAAVWMDEVRISPEYDYMSPWHYIWFPKGASYKSAPEDNLLSALNNAADRLRQYNGDERKRKEALMVILHLAGDLHQPLHVAYPDDKGGNATQVFYDGSLTSLHHVWDYDIIASQKISANTCFGLAQTFSDSELKHMESGDFVSWMEESRALLPQVYDYSGRVADNQYLQRNKAVVTLQLLRAGIRLAQVLNAIFVARPVAAADVPASAFTPEQAVKHFGAVATVCGKVYGGQFVKRTGMTFIDLGAAYPQSPFSVVIELKNRDRFKEPPEHAYNGQNICVTGVIRANEGKAVIFVSDAEQIDVPQR